MSRSISLANMSMDEIEEIIDNDPRMLIIDDHQYMREVMSVETSKKKFEGMFGEFRRIAGSYNQNWRWNED